jgi:hypothetical protein
MAIYGNTAPRRGVKSARHPDLAGTRQKTATDKKSYAADAPAKAGAVNFLTKA